MLPLDFKDRMRLLLGDDAEKLFFEMENGEAVRAFRVNGVKISRLDFENSGAAIDRTAMPTLKNAYYTKESYPGSLPEHHSGAIYMQDPSAMATVSAVTVESGMRVLDCCAAPGGKTGQLAAAAGDGGIAFANEYDAQRARILQGNVERLGLKNTVVLNLDTAVIRDTYPEFFDLVVCDAPCSGEGMFRKNDRAIEEWSVANVKMCAERQREILANVVKCVKRGGKLLYSTCTFSVEENEQNVAWLLDNYTEFELVEVSDELKGITADGICLDGCDYDMTKTRRFYPHVSRGEGQFIALISRRDDEENSTSVGANAIEHVAKTTENGTKALENRAKKSKKENKQSQNKQYVDLVELGKAFLEENVEGELFGELRVVHDKLWLCPEVPLTPYGVVAPGVCVGEAQKGRFVPHHQLFSAYGCQFKRRLCLENDSPVAIQYLFGEELALCGIRACDGENGISSGEELAICGIEAQENCADFGCDAAANSARADLHRVLCARADKYCAPRGLVNGWAAVIIGGCACGGAKISGAVAFDGALCSGAAKNHYPKGLRNKRIG